MIFNQAPMDSSCDVRVVYISVEYITIIRTLNDRKAFNTNKRARQGLSKVCKSITVMVNSMICHFQQ